MKVKNHKDFACFDYESVSDCSQYQLGDIVIRYPKDEEPEIGVVIQIHDRFELRTDMFGNSDVTEIKLATPEEIEKWRKSIIKDIE